MGGVHLFWRYAAACDEITKEISWQLRCGPSDGEYLHPSLSWARS